MKRWWAIFVLAACCALASCEWVEEEPERNVRFIGVGMTYPEDRTYVLENAPSASYTITSLSACAADVALMEETFRSRGYDGFSSCVITDRGEGNVAGGIGEALRAVRSSASDDDLTIVYYSGHGKDGTHPMVLDRRVGSGPHTLVLPSTQDILAALDRIPGDKLLLLDSCYSGGVVDAWDGGLEHHIASYFSDHGSSRIFLLAACREDELSYADAPDGGAHSRFTYWVCRELSRNRKISLANLAENVRTDMRSARPKQTVAANAALPLDLIL